MFHSIRRVIREYVEDQAENDSHVVAAWAVESFFATIKGLPVDDRSLEPPHIDKSVLELARKQHKSIEVKLEGSGEAQLSVKFESMTIVELRAYIKSQGGAR